MRLVNQTKNSITFHYYSSRGSWSMDVTIPCKLEVCDRCGGHGHHVNPAIDGNGLSQEDMDDPDFMDGYMAGHYDVRCEECGGEKVVPVADLDRMSWRQRAIWFDYLRQEAEARAEERMRLSGREW